MMMMMMKRLLCLSHQAGHRYNPSCLSFQLNCLSFLQPNRTPEVVPLGCGKSTTPLHSFCVAQPTRHCKLASSFSFLSVLFHLTNLTMCYSESRYSSMRNQAYAAKNTEALRGILANLRDKKRRKKKQDFAPPNAKQVHAYDDNTEMLPRLCRRLAFSWDGKSRHEEKSRQPDKR